MIHRNAVKQETNSKTTHQSIPGFRFRTVHCSVISIREIEFIYDPSQGHI